MAAARIVVAGAGPAGLMAAEYLASRDCAVTIYEAMPSPARKFLMAGRGGLNITHAEPPEQFRRAYGGREPELSRSLASFPQDAMIDWLHGLGIETFTGSSGRVFPRCMKASPVLRAWLVRLERLGVKLQTRTAWTGFDADGRPLFLGSDGVIRAVDTDATILAMGGGSWPRLGSTGAWVDPLTAAGADVAPLEPANCGVLIDWSSPIRERYAGQPLKRISIAAGSGKPIRGEAVITRSGLEGGAIYAISAQVRADIATTGRSILTLDLRPDDTIDTIIGKLAAERGKQSFSTFLRKTLRLNTTSITLIREAGPLPRRPADVARRIKALQLNATGVAGLERAISTAGGVRFEGLDDRLMLRGRPGVFVAGEMIDWEAPTGGYLLQGSFATAVTAADGALKWLAEQPDEKERST
ncbi:MAG: TIGR03862 family flavoprotein [Hyphomicrobiaceae bacterium]|nr:TIGR03862 family flavoprotein [Hyphomicrobiaceae bacterium]